MASARIDPVAVQRMIVSAIAAAMAGSATVIDQGEDEPVESECVNGTTVRVLQVQFSGGNRRRGGGGGGEPDTARIVVAVIVNLYPARAAQTSLAMPAALRSVINAIEELRLSDPADAGTGNPGTDHSIQFEPGEIGDVAVISDNPLLISGRVRVPGVVYRASGTSQQAV